MNAFVLLIGIIGQLGNSFRFEHASLESQELSVGDYQMYGKINMTTPAPVICGDKCIQLIPTSECPPLSSAIWQDEVHCNVHDVTQYPVGTYCESDEFPHCGSNSADNCGGHHGLDVYRIVEWCGPTPLPTPGPAGAAGDPHVTNTGGEKFDIKHDGFRELRVTGVHRGHLRDWNAKHVDCAVRIGDRIVEVNGTRGSSEDLVSVMKGSLQVRMLVVRRPDKFRVELAKIDGKGQFGIGFACNDLPKFSGPASLC